MLRRHATRLCPDPRDKVFALHGLPFFDCDGLDRPKPDYSLSLQEVTLAPLLYWDQLLGSGLTGVEQEYLLDTIVTCIRISIGLDCISQDFLAWLRRRVCWSNTAGEYIVRVGSNREVACCGPVLCAPIRMGVIPEASRGQTPKPCRSEGYVTRAHTSQYEVFYDP